MWGQSVTGPALRRSLGLRSTCFSIEWGDGNFTVTTQGYGHGVGLSQWGAKALAEQGASCQEILAHYFPHTIEWGDGNFTVTTQGYGHGVGLSQWGAKALAEQGASCQEILAHYFPHTELRE